MTKAQNIREQFEMSKPEIVSGTERNYWPELDGIRFIAISVVVIWHFSLRFARLLAGQEGLDSSHFYSDVGSIVPNGELGVAIFFILSGYLVSMPFLSSARRCLDPAYIWSFYKRRFFRLYVPYVVALTVAYIALSIFKIDPADAPRMGGAGLPLWQSYLASLTYMHGIVFGAAPGIIPPAWSLEIEIFFYLLIPFLVLIYLSVRSVPLRISFGIFASFGLFLVSMHLKYDVGTSYFKWNILGYLYFFISGIVFCDVYRNYHIKKFKYGYLIAILSVLTMYFGGTLYNLIYSESYDEKNVHIIIIAELMIFIGSTLFFFIVLYDEKIKKILSYPIITMIGSVCYSIYLTHVPTLQFSLIVSKRISKYCGAFLGDFVFILLSVVTVSIAAAVFFHFVERPFFNRKLK